MEDFVDFVVEKEPVLEAEAPAPRKKNAFYKISAFLTNKFFIATAAFAVIMFFLDKNDLLTAAERRKELNSLELSKEHYSKELMELRKIKTNLETDPVTIQKLAREKYLMKRENEDIFVMEDNTKPEAEK